MWCLPMLQRRYGVRLVQRSAGFGVRLWRNGVCVIFLLSLRVDVVIRDLWL